MFFKFEDLQATAGRGGVKSKAENHCQREFAPYSRPKICRWNRPRNGCTILSLSVFFFRPIASSKFEPLFFSSLNPFDPLI